MRLQASWADASIQGAHVAQPAAARGSAMTSIVSKPFAFALVPSVAAFLLVQACGGGGEARAQAAADPVEGVWESQVSVRDCASGATVRTFKGLAKFERSGGVSAVNNQPPALNSVAFGRWDAGSTAGSYTAQFRFFRFAPDGAPLGSQRVTHTFTLPAGGNSSSGTIAAQLLDNADTVVGAICAVTTNTRLY
jgi:hypothetical protein